MAVKTRAIVALLIAASFGVAVSDNNVPNWVSPINATDAACYRKSYLSLKTCATGYESDGIAACWAQCGLSYPVECGAECITQGSDCTSEIVSKIASVAKVALNAATSGVFGHLVTASAALQLGIKCGQALFTATSSLVSYVGELQADATPSEQLLSVLNQSDLVVNEIPSAVCTCLGIPISDDTLAISAQVVDVASKVVTSVVENGVALLEPSKFLGLMSDVGVDESVQALDGSSLSQLQDIWTAGSTCGSKLQSIFHKVTQFVIAFKTKELSINVNSIRAALSESDIFLKEIPDVTNNCVRNITEDAFSVRDSLRSIMSTITDGLIGAAVKSDGSAVSTSTYLSTVADMGLDVIGTLDPTGIVNMLSTFIQPICGPTAFVGTIDDGSLADALALTAEDQAFNGSYGTWSNSGDGTVKITFVSTDTENVTVVIHSGGDTVAKVKVPSGKTVSWNSTLKELQGKTMYFDRWRPGFLGMPSSSGGSLLMWVPRPSAGGKIELLVKINGDGSDKDSSKTDIEHNGGETGSGYGTKADGKPSAKISKDEDQTQQTLSSKESGNSGGSKDSSPTPASTSIRQETVTSAPTTDQTPTKESHKTGTNVIKDNDRFCA